MDKKEWCKRMGTDALLVSLGLMVSGLGVALHYWLRMGSSTFSTFADGLHLLLGTSQGVANLVANLLLLAPVLLVGRDTIRMGTFITAFTAGLYIDLFGGLLAGAAVPSSLVARALLCFAGVALVGVGLSIYVAAGAGLGPVEAAVELLLRATGWQYKYAKWIVDAAFFGVGVLLGGAFGIATVMNLLLAGTIMQYCIPVFARLLGREAAPAQQEPLLDSPEGDVLP